jgi:hypothetical protein
MWIHEADLSKITISKAEKTEAKAKEA